MVLLVEGEGMLGGIGFAIDRAMVLLNSIFRLDSRGLILRTLSNFK